VHSHRIAHLASRTRERKSRDKNPEQLLQEALDVLRAVRANYRAWRELWPHEQAAVCTAGETIEAELKRRAA
jgi:hypothetical protein